MSSVYQNSWCNIVSAREQQPPGCFTHRDTREMRPIVFNVLKDGDVNGSYSLTNVNTLLGSLKKNPLQGRGWILQELILSPRNLLFGEIQAFWQCSSITACESWFKGLRNVSEGLSQVSELWLHKVSVGSGTGLKDDLNWWMSVVERYSTTQLTFPGKDKLLALSGLARAINIDGTYAAGLWLQTMPHSLLWRPLRSISGSPPEYQAPSWSWASVNAQIKLDVEHPLMEPEDFLASIEGANIDLQDEENKFGAVSSGELIVKGPMIVLNKLPRLSSQNNTKGSPTAGEDGTRIPSDPEDPNIGMNFDYQFDYPKKSRSHRSLYCMALVYHNFVQTHEVCCLLLQFNPAERQFTRVGIAVLFSETKRLSRSLMLEWFNNAFLPSCSVKCNPPVTCSTPDSTSFTSRHWNEAHHYWEYQISIV